jgi:hypothetical protein
MKKFILIAAMIAGQLAFADARVMNPGEATGQLVVLSPDDVKGLSPKYKALSPLSIPVWGELPLDLAVVAGSITLKQQNLLSHVQLKSRARHTPNLDISDLQGGIQNPLFKGAKDGDWIKMVLSKDGKITIEPATEAAAMAANKAKQVPAVQLRADVTTKKIFRHEELGYKDLERVGSKAANYAELVKVLNTASRTVTRPGYAIPFYYYQEFLNTNPKVQEAITKMLADPLMNRVAKIEYREAKLKAVRDLFEAGDAVVSDELITQLLQLFDASRINGYPRRWKLRSSTNSEDLPNFNGAGLYESYSYKPVNKEGKEKKAEKKKADLRKALQKVWASVWSLRAYEERSLFRIPHADVKMGVEVNLGFGNEGADGVVVTKNVADDPKIKGTAVYIETQRGDEHGVANPKPGVKPEKILVLYDPKQPLNKALYKVNVIQKSNIADDTVTILPTDNPNPVMSDDEIKDLTEQCLKAQAAFRKMHNKPDMSLDLEFKVDSEDTGHRAVYVKQARPYID